LVTLTLWPGSYNGRVEEFNFEWNAAIEVTLKVTYCDQMIPWYCSKTW